MATTSSTRTAGAPARDLRWERGLRVALLAAALAGVPLLARDAVAQRSGVIQATAYVTSSILGARLQADTSGAAVSATPRPIVRRLRVEGVGVLDVRTVAGEEISVTSRLVDSVGGPTRVVQISYVST
ncbi:MAG: hypothetical protein ABSG61_08925 [Gemmatimonadales bacterium]|jgi:hypothetical protein